MSTIYRHMTAKPRNLFWIFISVFFLRSCLPVLSRITHLIVIHDFYNPVALRADFVSGKNAQHSNYYIYIRVYLLLNIIYLYPICILYIYYIIYMPSLLHASYHPTQVTILTAIGRIGE